MSLPSYNEKAFGLDISDRSLRLIQLKGTYHHPKVQLYNEVKLPIGCLENGEVKKSDEFLALLTKLIKTRQGHGRLENEVIAVLPEARSYLKLIHLEDMDPQTKKEEITEKLVNELPQHIPLDLKDLFFDWQIVNSNEHSLDLLVGAAPKTIVDSYVNLLTQAGLIPTVLEIEAAAIARMLDKSQATNNAQIVIDIGANRTGLFMFDQTTIIFTVSLPISGNKITSLITQAVDLDWQQAEQAKIVCGLDEKKCQGAVLEIFQETIDELDYQIHQAVAYYQNNFNQVKPIERIILTGGGANFINIDKVLEEKLKIKTVISQPWQKLTNPNHTFFTPSRSQSFTTALGLGLRGLKPATFL